MRYLCTLCSSVFLPVCACGLGTKLVVCQGEISPTDRGIQYTRICATVVIACLHVHGEMVHTHTHAGRTRAIGP